MPSSSRATRSAPCSTGSVTVPARTASSSYRCPSSAALATAERRPTSAATGPPERRNAGWRNASSTAARASARADRTSASSSNGVNAAAAGVPASNSATVTQSSWHGVGIQ